MSAPDDRPVPRRGGGRPRAPRRGPAHRPGPRRTWPPASTTSWPTSAAARRRAGRPGPRRTPRHPRLASAPRPHLRAGGRRGRRRPRRGPPPGPRRRRASPAATRLGLHRRPQHSTGGGTAAEVGPSEDRGSADGLGVRPDQLSPARRRPGRSGSAFAAPLALSSGEPLRPRRPRPRPPGRVLRRTTRAPGASSTSATASASTRPGTGCRPWSCSARPRTGAGASTSTSAAPAQVVASTSLRAR